MNKKGFTLVELLVSIAILSIVLAFLLNLLISLKEYNSSTSTTSDLAISQALVTKEINGDIYTNGGIVDGSVNITNNILSFKVKGKSGVEENRRIEVVTTGSAKGTVKYYKNNTLTIAEKPLNDEYVSVTYTKDATTSIHKIIIALGLETSYNCEIYYTD